MTTMSTSRPPSEMAMSGRRPRPAPPRVEAGPRQVQRDEEQADQRERSHVEKPLAEGGEIQKQCDRECERRSDSPHDGILSLRIYGICQAHVLPPSWLSTTRDTPAGSCTSTPSSTAGGTGAGFGAGAAAAAFHAAS